MNEFIPNYKDLINFKTNIKLINFKLYRIFKGLAQILT